MAEVLIPFLREQLSMLFNQLVKLAQFPATKPVIDSEPNGLQPKLRVAFRLFDVNMSRFVTFVAEQEEPISTAAKDGWRTAS